MGHPPPPLTQDKFNSLLCVLWWLGQFSVREVVLLEIFNHCWQEFDGTAMWRITVLDDDELI
jgi:hypothetical protein